MQRDVIPRSTTLHPQRILSQLRGCEQPCLGTLDFDDRQISISWNIHGPELNVSSIFLKLVLLQAPCEGQGGILPILLNICLCLLAIGEHCELLFCYLSRNNLDKFICFEIHFSVDTLHGPRCLLWALK